MQAIQIHEYGNAEVLRYEEVEKPQPQAGDVLVRVVATSFNPLDAKIRQGDMKEMMPKQLPFILGWDAAGVVEAIGADVQEFKVGDEVFTMPAVARGGTYAEYVAVAADEVALKPQKLSLVEAAALPMVGLTALLALDTAELKAGQTILIHGGAGGVGSMAIQIAKARGAHVITTAAGDDANLVKSLGADEVIDYKTTNFKDVVKDVDVVLDILGGQAQEDSFAVLRPWGILIATAQPPSPAKAAAHGVLAKFIFTRPSAAALQAIAALVDAGQLRPLVGRTLPLAEARRAHEEKGGKGKTVLTV